ncbi:uncharacterized protein [Dermacentor albipictus]|uniref:uncharacterized protein n=1 Tax=Dermacentor albipictus TaxID=60249 RepID=UPI0038FD105E
MALATNLGTPSFDENQDKWDIYLTRLEAFFEANDIKTDDKKRALLVSTLSTKTVGVLAGQCAPQKVNALSYKDALTILNNHYAPKTNQVAASYKFFTRNQAASESVRDYVVELRKLADNCHFGTSLDRMLRDRIVCGIRNRAVQQTLLEKTELTLAQAETIAIAAETAALEVSAMTRLDNEAAVCTVASKSRRYQTFTKDKQSHTECARCGNYDHEASDCPHKKEQCFHCRKTGHFARKCCSQSGLRAGRRRDGVANAVHYESAVSETEEGDISSVFTLQESREKKSLLQAFRRVIRWGGVPLNMIIDTGSPFSIIPQEVYLKHRLSWPRLSKCKHTLNCYLGKLPIVGELHLEANFAGKTVPATLIVTGCSGPSLCGRDLIQAFSLLPSGFLAAVQPTSADPDSLRTEFPALFEPGLGNIQGPPVKLHIREGAQSKFHKPPRFQSGNQVWVRNFGQGERWRPGIVKSIEGSRLVTVDTPDGLARRHFDQIFRRVPVSPVTPKAEASDSLQPSPDNKHRPTSTPEARCSLATPEASGATPVPSTTPPTSVPAEQALSVPSPPVLRRSTRQRRPVQRLQF